MGVGGELAWGFYDLFDADFVGDAVMDGFYLGFVDGVADLMVTDGLERNYLGAAT